jgi:hypothetical protein
MSDGTSAATGAKMSHPSELEPRFDSLVELLDHKQFCRTLYSVFENIRSF